MNSIELYRTLSNSIELKQKCDETVRSVVSQMVGKSEHEINKALQDAHPFNRNNLSAWRTYGEAIYKLTGRQMFGYDYAAIKAKENRQVAGK